MINNTASLSNTQIHHSNDNETISEKELSNIIYKYLHASRKKSLFIGAAKLGLLRSLYVSMAESRVDNNVIEALSETEFPFNVDAISERDFNILAKNFARAFPLLVDPSEFSWDKNSAYIQPKEVTDFIVKIAEVPKGVTVYNPFAGLASYAIALPENQVIGEEINIKTWAVAQIRLLASGINSHMVNQDSFIELSSTKKYDVIITSPVYLKEPGRRINDIIEKLYDKLNDNGKLACLVPHFILDDPDYKKLRERLISDRSLKAVITLPNNIFSRSSLTQDILLIQRGNPNEAVIMADASGATRFAKSTFRMTTFDWEQFLNNLEEGLENYYESGCIIDESAVGVPINFQDLLGSNLTPSIYLISKPEKGVALSNLASFIDETINVEDAEYFISSSSIPKAMHRQPYVPGKCDSGKFPSAKSQVFISGDAVLLSIDGGMIRTVYMENFHGKIAFQKGFIKVLSPVAGISAKYLAALLSIKIVANQIKAILPYRVIQRFTKFDLSQIIVPDHPSEEEKEKLVSEVLSAEMSDLEKELQLTIDNQKREIRSTRHAINQTLSALSSNWEQLNMFAKRKEGTLHFSDTIGRINPISIEDLMGSIGYAISTLERQVESLGFEKADFGKEVEINPYEFINDYITKHSTPEFRMINVGNDATTEISYINEGTEETTYSPSVPHNYIYAPKRLLERVFDNIVYNAKDHGFTSDNDNNEVRFDCQSDNGNIVITIANNGTPLKEGVTSEDVFMSGFSTALNENASDGTLHSGNGGFEIKSLMDSLGSVEVISDPNSEFPVIYKLTFDKTNSLNLED